MKIGDKAILKDARHLLPSNYLKYIGKEATVIRINSQTVLVEFSKGEFRMELFQNSFRTYFDFLEKKSHPLTKIFQNES